MTDRLIDATLESIANAFSGQVVKDERPGYGGLIVSVDSLWPFCEYIKNELGFDYLASITGVDYFPEPRMEVVYYVCQSKSTRSLNFKVQVDRDNPVVPSIVKYYPGAEFQEREEWDLLGIKFENHPDLRRILMWEDFNGFPLRKDWREAFYEEETKPFKSRHPDGIASHIEDKNPFLDNVEYPAGFDPENYTFAGDEELYKMLLKKHGGENGFRTDRIIVNLGPQHPSTHGVFRMVAVLDGETLVDLKPVMGYLHRCHEKIAERNTFLQNMPFTDRLDYISSMSNNFAYALAVEKLMGIKPSERAEYIRIIMAELTRISSHIMNIGFLLNDLGAFFTPALYALKERELILDIFEEVSGSRMMCNYFRFGGVVRDITPQTLERIKLLAETRLPKKIDELDRYISKNEILLSRCIGVGALTAEQAVGLSASGPILRSTGVAYDLRKMEPYGIYDRFDFDVIIGKNGDVYDRYLVRLNEMRQSLRIIRQALKDLPDGPVMSVKSQYQIKVPPGEAYGRVEGTKGELGFYVVSNGKTNPFRYHVRSPSFINLTGLAQMCIGQKIADIVVILGSLDIVLGEVDR